MEEEPIERLPAKEPQLEKIIEELEQAQIDSIHYIERTEHARSWWQCNWPGQTYDGRKHARGEQDVVLPWEGASDSRLRIVDTIIDQHVSLAKTAFFNSTIECHSSRPLVYGRASNIAQKVLEYLIFTQMRQELLRELSLAFTWKYALGLSFISVEWEQQRTKALVPLKVEDLQQIAEQSGDPGLLLELDNPQPDGLIQFLQSLSDILDKDEAKKIISELRNDGMSQIPIPNYSSNKPKWTALLPMVDIIIPSECHNVQTERWVSRRELVNESELTDRIKTDNYDEDFVEEAVKHKGDFADWLANPTWRWWATGSERDLIELHHFIYRNVEDGIPCMYRVVFNQAVAAEKKIFAINKVFEYQHQQYPLVPLRRNYDYRPLLASVGIAEEAYTDEMDIKAQQDGLTDRTDLIHAPPMIVPTLRAQGIKNMYGPRAVMSALRPNEVAWAPLPPSDNTPIAIIEMVKQRLDERYSISGNEIDPMFKSIRQRELANDINGEMELVVEQTLQLAQQFMTDEEVERIAGKGEKPWNLGLKDIQGRYEISVTYDVKLSDIEYLKEKLQLFQVAMQFNQAGGANMTKLFARIMEIVDPDAADLVVDDQQSATQREVNEEKQAAVSILSGVEPDKPMFGNHQLRMQTLVQHTLQSPNPEVQQAIMQSKPKQDMIKNRMEFFQNQIQQHQLNPQIGRSLSTKTFEPKQPAEVSY